MINKKWELFQRGMRRAEWLGKPDGAVMEWTDESGLTLFVFYEYSLLLVHGSEFW